MPNFQQYVSGKAAAPTTDSGFRLLRAVVGLQAEYNEYCAAESDEELLSELADTYFWITELSNMIPMYEDIKYHYELPITTCINDLLDLTEKFTRKRSYVSVDDLTPVLTIIYTRFLDILESEGYTEDDMEDYLYDKLG